MKEPDRCHASANYLAHMSIDLSANVEYWDSSPFIRLEVSGQGSNLELRVIDPSLLREAARSMLEHADWLEFKQSEREEKRRVQSSILGETCS